MTKMRGGAGAAEYGVFVNGTQQAQMSQLNAAANGSAQHNQNLLQYNKGWTGGKAK